MAKFCITYHMENKDCTAESCVVVPLSEDYAKILRAQGADWFLAHPIYSFLHYLCELQGYRFSGICTIEEVKQ